MIRQTDGLEERIRLIPPNLMCDVGFSSNYVISVILENPWQGQLEANFTEKFKINLEKSESITLWRILWPFQRYHP